MFEKVLLPTDGSETALRAAAYLVNLLQERPGMKVTLLNVYTIPPAFNTYDSPIPPVGLVDSIKQMAQRALDRTEAVFKEAGFSVETMAMEGDPGRDIPQFARNKGYDHIVMGSKGTGSISGLVFGSVANKVLHVATCPVIIIK
ncbi:MAG: universal stress protein [Bacillota bacterium]|nr:universal stress protein [Bacillota bacterium]